jgi:integrase/recombinase XerD
MLSLIYACGLRRGELINLKPMDVDSKHHLLIIRSGKGRKDRVVPLSDKLLDLLREYYRAYRPEEWLFEGQLSGSRYSEQSLQCVLKQALKKARIRKPATLHWLRHSYATHLLEKGVTIDSSKKCSDIKAQKQLKFTRMSRKSVFKKYAHHSTISDQNVQIPMLVCKILSNIRHTKPRDSACIA